MMDENRDLSSRVVIDTTNFKAGVSELNRQVRVIESGFKAAAAGMEDWSHTSEGLEARMKALTNMIGLQQQKVDGLQRVYHELAAGGKTSARELEELQIRINNETGALNKMQVELGQTNTGLANFGKSSKDAGGNVNILKGSLTEINSAMAIGRQAIQMIGQAYDILAGDTLKYIATVRDISRETGQSAEVTSRMIQMVDDLGVDLKTLELAAKGAATKGIALTTENLARMSDEFNALVTTEEKNTYLLQHFGKSGLEVGKIFAKTGDEIREASKAVAENLILTQKQLDAGRNLEIGLDNLNDTWTGIKYTLGNAVIPVLVSAAGALNDLLTGTEKVKTAFEDHREEIVKTIPTYQEYNRELVRAAFVSGELNKYHITAADYAKLTDKAIDNLAGKVGGLSEATWEAVRASDPLIDKFNRLKEGASNLTQPVIDDAQVLDALKKSMDANTISMGALTAAAIYNKMAVDLDEEGARNLALAMGLLDPAAYNALGQLDSLKQRFFDGKITAEEYAGAVAALNTNINNIPKNTTVYIDYVLRTVGASPLPEQPAIQSEPGPTKLHYNGETLGAPEGYQWWWVNGQWVTQKIPGKAAGGSVFAGSPYVVGESGPELFLPGANGSILSNSNLGGLMAVLKSLTGGLNMAMPGGAGNLMNTPAVTHQYEINVTAPINNNFDPYVLAQIVCKEIQRARS